MVCSIRGSRSTIITCYIWVEIDLLTLCSFRSLVTVVPCQVGLWITQELSYSFHVILFCPNLELGILAMSFEIMISRINLCHKLSEPIILGLCGRLGNTFWRETFRIILSYLLFHLCCLLICPQIIQNVLMSWVHLY